MTIGEALTRVTIWAALAAYFAVTLRQLADPAPVRARDGQLLLWSFGCAAYVLHVICAFQFYHHWSHEAALAHTAVATASVTGWKSGIGLYVNYAFTLGWVVDVVWWWTRRESRSNPPWWLAGLWRGFMFFIVFNATVVFGRGPVRWFGLAGCLSIIYFAVRRRLRMNPGVG